MPLLTIARDQNNQFYCVYWTAEIPWSKTIEVTESELQKIKYETLEHVDMILKYLFATRTWRIRQTIRDANHNAS